jgi:ABC-type transport system substrate-binding protein
MGKLSNSDLQRIKNGNVANARLLSVPGQYVTYLDLCQVFDYMQDVRVRRAIAHAVDWQALVESVWGETVVLADSMLPVDTKYYKSMGIYEYDPELSRSLLEEAGYGSGLEMSIYSIPGPEAEAFEIIQSMLADVGITLKFELAEFSVLLDSLIKGSPMGFTGTTNNVRDPDKSFSYRRMSSDFAQGRFASQELDDLVGKGASTLDETERERIYLEIQQYCYDNVISIPVSLNIASYAVHDRIDNFEPEPNDKPDLRYVTFK